MKKEAVPAAGPVTGGPGEMKIYSKRTRVIRENLELWSFVIPAATLIIPVSYTHLVCLAKAAGTRRERGD